MLIDTHAHYDDAKFAEDLETCLEDARAAGVSHIVNAAQDLATTRKIMEMSKTFPYIYGTAGIHPHEAGKADASHYEAIRRLTAGEEAARNKIVAIGETGLDYYYDFSPREVQKENFTRHIEIALEVGLPLVVHDRDAHEDCLEILDQNGAFSGKVVFHCYSGSLEFARILAEKGCYFSFGGAITFKNAKKFPEILRGIPADRLMLETDCPYMTPEPHRGKRNSSAYLPLVAGKMAEILGKSVSEIETLTSANAKVFYGI
ncbi:MAG: TatD family hydrolase [Clostridia bacterium]|nr:TatD family hydrolase [Clostridia bacterium]